MGDELRQLIEEAVSETTGWGIVLAVLVLVAVWPVAALVGWGVRSLVRPIPGVRVGAEKLVARVAQAIVVVAAMALALSALNVGPGVVTVVVLVVAVVAAVFVQAMIQNLAAGAALPYMTGDQIESHGYAGTVADITLRQTVIETLDRRIVYIPNVDVMENPIVVFSAFEGRRSSIDVGITYATDIEAVSELLVEAISQVEGVHHDPPPYARPSGFGDGMYLLTLRWWHDPDLATQEAIKGAVLTKVKRTLDDAGIPIPPPAAIFLTEPP